MAKDSFLKSFFAWSIDLLLVDNSFSVKFDHGLEEELKWHRPFTFLYNLLSFNASMS